jgi:hypothetical protein
MDLTELTRDIHRLTEDLNVWSSEFCIPFSTGQCLDVGSAIMGEQSSTPIGASDQPLKYPPGKHGSVYIFPSTYCGPESWPALLAILKQSTSSCSLFVRQVYKRKSNRRKVSNHISCCHCRLYESNSGATYTDDCLGAINVPKEYLKRVKKSGNNLKGLFIHDTLVYCLFSFPSLYCSHIIIMLLNSNEKDGLQVQTETP